MRVFGKVLVVPARYRTKKLADTVLFLALGMIFNVFSFSTGTPLGRVSFVYMFAYLAGIFLGPWLGGFTAFFADLLPALLLPQGPFNPLLSLSSTVMAIIPGLIFRYSKKMPVWAKFLVSVVLDFVICTCIIAPFGEIVFFDIYGYAIGKSIGAALGIESKFVMISIHKAITQPLWIFINSIIAVFLFRRLNPLYERRYPDKPYWVDSSLKATHEKAQAVSKSENKPSV